MAARHAARRGFGAEVSAAGSGRAGGGAAQTDKRHGPGESAGGHCGAALARASGGAAWAVEKDQQAVRAWREGPGAGGAPTNHAAGKELHAARRWRGVRDLASMAAP